MVKELITKAALARMAGVSAAAITQAIQGPLAKAVVGKRVDKNHKVVVAYLEKKAPVEIEQPASGIDARYQDAVNHCNRTNRFTVSNIARGLKIGFARANRIFVMMEAAGTDKPLPAGSNPPPPNKVKKPKPPAPPPLSPGVASTTKTKKQHAAAALNNPDKMVFEVPEDILSFAEMTLRQLIERFGTDTAFCDWLKATKSIEDINEKRLKNAATEGELVSRHLVKVGIIDPINEAHIRMLADGSKNIAVNMIAMHDSGSTLSDCEKFVAEQISSFIRPVKSKVSRALMNA